MAECKHCSLPLNRSLYHGDESLKSCPKCSAANSEYHVYYEYPEAFGSTPARASGTHPDGPQSYCVACRSRQTPELPTVLCPDTIDLAGGERGAIQQSPEDRVAVEMRAMEVVITHLQNEDWNVKDVHERRGLGYDLHCHKGDTELRVEVKGTTGSGSTVMLTVMEVDQARAHPELTALAIVSSIYLEPSPDGPTATGGSLRILRPWDPDAFGTLRETSYRLMLPPIVAPGLEP